MVVLHTDDLKAQIPLDLGLLINAFNVNEPLYLMVKIINIYVQINMDICLMIGIMIVRSVYSPR